MQKYRDVVLNARGMPVVGALVLVNNYPSGIAASLFSSNNANPIGSQLSTDANGQFAFYAADGRYSLTISGIGITTQTINDILLQDPATDISFPGGAALVGTTPTATLVSTNVQTSLAELDAKKIPFTTLAASSGSSLVGYLQGSSGSSVITQQAKNQQFVSVTEFVGCDPTGVLDSTAAFNSASAASNFPIVPPGNYKITGVLNNLSAFIYYGATVNGINATGITAPSLNTNTIQAITSGIIGGQGSTLQTQFHSNWNVIQTNAADNPTEWQVYSSASGGIVSIVGGTNQINWVSGSQFRTYWAGLPYLYVDGVLYKVLAVTSTTALTVQTVGGGAVTWGSTASVPYYFCVTSTVGTCNTNGTAVTWQTGQQFISLASSIVINGVTYNATYNSPTSMTLGSSAGVQTGVAFSQYGNINNELSILRLQSTAYADQENFCITQTANGAIIETQYGGLGKYRPIKIRTGENPAGTQQVMIALYPAATLGNPGTLLLGGDFNNQVLNVGCNVNNVNYFFVNGGATGVTPSIAMRGSDANVSLGFDTKGSGSYTFTSHSFGNVEFQIFGTGGSSWLTVSSSSSATPTVGVSGVATDIDVLVAPKGAGLVRFGAYTAGALTSAGSVSIKDASGTIRKLMVGT